MLILSVEPKLFLGYCCFYFVKKKMKKKMSSKSEIMDSVTQVTKAKKSTVSVKVAMVNSE